MESARRSRARLPPVISLTLVLSLCVGATSFELTQAWYFSLKTSKGYCGLVPLSTTAGGYGFAISCANKLPVYDSQFTLLSADAPSSPGGAAWAGADAAAVEAAAGPAAGQRGHHGYMTDEAHRVRLLLAGGADPRAHLQDGELGSAAGAATIAREAGAAAAGAAPVHDPNAPVVVTSGTPLRLLSRSAGLCGSVPPPGRASSQQQRPQQQQQQQGAASQAGNTGSQARGGPAPAGGFAACSRLLPAAWWAWLHCRALPALQAALHAVSRALQLPQTFPLLPAPGACRDAAAAAPAGATGAGADAGGSGPGGPPLLGDTAPWPVTCVLAQPGSLQWRLFKSDLKDNATVDLAVDWLYLMEGDKYCTLADVAGMTAVVSCHLDAPGWTGYKFQLQTMSYPRSRLTSQLTGGDCSVRLPSLPPPHDWACGGAGQPPSPDRSPDFDLVLQTPGSALAAGVVVGITTYSHGLVGNQLQRCCPMISSPHIIFCAVAAPGSAPPAECWYQLYDVKLLRVVEALSATGIQEQDPDVDGASTRLSGSGSGGLQGRGFWGAFSRSLFAEMSPVATDPDSDDADEQSSSRTGGAAGVERGGGQEEAGLDPEDGHEGEEVGLVAELAAAAGRLRFPWDAVVPISDGSLVMFMSKAFARYCSVSVDGDLLCVSAQASNASRNLFTLRLPPLPPLGGAGVGAMGQGKGQVGAVP
ncbi:hypothetical protein CHLRE_12g509450v5 [Chlamydomonas reinhardtii]|uniref:Uncharacterized protein n=1 Tax=Chlamydomonas reinhardtii TaxID=3055 RepID=A0A2K3D2N3_CHLRE|nr:uncharacterized protein CHLRE_12g509450v5 [Chlamydomonas reinhardtii]PNW74796.1 hypothetical protein CHLRE_12g509450v5 [Chlamydomonas reinhardtii]